MNKTPEALAAQFAIVFAVKHEAVTLTVTVSATSAIDELQAAYLVAALIAPAAAVMGVERVADRQARINITDAGSAADAIQLRQRLAKSRLVLRVATLLAVIEGTS